MEVEFLLRVDLPSEPVVVSARLCYILRSDCVDILLVKRPAEFEFEQVVDTEGVICVFEETIVAGVSAHLRLIGSHWHCFDEISLTGFS